MNIRKLSLITIVIAVAPLILIAGAPVHESSRLEGIVADPTGAGIKGAFVFVHWDPAGSSVGLQSNVGIAHDEAARTDVNGKFSIALPPGFYDVLFSASAFSPKAKKVRILPNSVFRYNVRLALDREVTDALADKFK